MTQVNKKDLITFLTEGYPITFMSEQQREALFDLLVKMVNDDQENYWAAPRKPQSTKSGQTQPLQILIDAGNAPIVLVSISDSCVEVLLPEKQETKDWKQHVANISLLILTTLNMWCHLQQAVKQASLDEKKGQKFPLRSIMDFHSSQSTEKSNPARKLSAKHTRKTSLLNKKLALLIK